MKARAADVAALRCDFLETYHVMDFRALPARQAALFACGLGPGSRIAQKLSGSSVGLDTMLLAVIADAVRLLVWQNTKDGMDGRNRPWSITERLAGGGKQKETLGFDTPEAFDAWRAQMIGGEKNA